MLIQIKLLIFDFHAKMGLIKDRNGIDLTEAEAEEVARIRPVQKRSSQPR